jgi:ABC-type nitrate/sulfonate/bicarbonate transport system substrate-binding protein
MKVMSAPVNLLLAMGLFVSALMFPMSAPAANTPLRVAYSSISGSAIVPFIALDKGLFAKYGLDVELIYVAGSQAMQSLLSGTTPIGIQGIEPVFRVNAHGGDTVMILGLVTKPPFSIITRPEITDYRELKGKPMGVTRYGSSTDLLLRLTLDKWGLKPETDVPILQMGGVPPILAGMQSKKIFGGPLSLPTLARAKQEGFRELADIADLVPEYQVAGVVTRRAFIKQNPEVVRGFIKAIAEARSIFINDANYVKKIMRERLKIDDPAVVEETRKNYPRYMPAIPYPSRAGIAVIKAFLEKSEPALQKLSIDDQIDTQLVRELEESGFFESGNRVQ